MEGDVKIPDPPDTRESQSDPPQRCTYGESGPARGRTRTTHLPGERATITLLVLMGHTGVCLIVVLLGPSGAPD